MQLPYWKRILIWLDQGVNVIVFNGSVDETVSARSYRQRAEPKWAAMMQLLDAVFFWEVEHCKQSYEWERDRRDLPSPY